MSNITSELYDVSEVNYDNFVWFLFLCSYILSKQLQSELHEACVPYIL